MNYFYEFPRRINGSLEGEGRSKGRFLVDDEKVEKENQELGGVGEPGVKGMEKV